METFIYLIGNLYRFRCVGSLVTFTGYLSSLMACFVFLSVVIMEPNLDDPGFVSPLDPDPSPRAPVPPSGSSSSSEGAVDVCRKCLRCHRRMSRKSFDSHTFCSVCHGFDCELDTWCEECTD